MIVAEKCEDTQYLLAVCSKMVITIHVVPNKNPSKMEDEFGVLAKYADVSIISALGKQRQEG